MITKYFCKNFQQGNVICELCLINKTYIDIQNVDCKSCFEPEINSLK